MHGAWDYWILKRYQLKLLAVTDNTKLDQCREIIAGSNSDFRVVVSLYKGWDFPGPGAEITDSR